ncbi:MAG: hypothetical protein ACU0GG_12315 [Paracoccaceae bacterium]
MTAKAESYPNGKHETTAQSAIEDARSAVEDGISDAREAVDEFTKDAGEQVRKASSQATTFVKENPGMALLGAVGVGVLVGLAMRSR